MPFEFHVRGRNSAAEAAAVQTAFTNLITALHGAISHKVDAGGSMLDYKPLTADELTPHGQKPGDAF